MTATAATAVAARPQADRPPLVRLRGLTKSYGSMVAVKPLDLDIHSGDFYALLGPSGCGKTTLLRMIGGFTEPTAGTVEIDGVDVTRMGPERRPTNMVFQGYGLFPHMTVRQNIAYGLKLAKLPPVEVETRVKEIIGLVRLEQLAERRPDALSGGQAQRVALARALVMRPRVLLLDEPLAALDLQLRKAMQEELRRIHRSIGGTFVFVTHDQGEAMALANRIAVMDAGACVQEGGPEEIYGAPRTRFISTFIGEANVLPGRRQGGRVTLEAGGSFADAGADEAVVVVVRPEAMALGGNLPQGAVKLAGRLADSVFLGPYVRYRVELPGGGEIILHSQDFALRHRLAVDDTVEVGWTTDAQRVLADR
jgi:ABC-type Fe3+/spermidine/putrescine transport system ATPase subunit